MLVKTLSSAIYGISAQMITIEVNVSRGIRYHMVGLPDVAVKESLQRIETAITSSGFRMPRQKIVVNLAPAYIRKEGSAFDLPIALGILAASKQLDPSHLENRLFLGELSLGGDLLPIRGVLPMTLMAKAKQLMSVILPAANAQEAAVVEGIDAYAMSSLAETVSFLKRGIDKPPHTFSMKAQPKPRSADGLDFSDVLGQEAAKRALEIAAAGGHNVLLVGPPGAGKSMLARLLPTILPPITLREALETAQLYSITGKLSHEQLVMRARPFRAPHHTISPAALAGGGSYPHPGEISLAHNGVLFLDEFPEFRRPVLEVLRQPLESHVVTITRARVSTDFPADFILVAAMNPCPCGFLNHPTKNCPCGSRVIRQYMSRISGPLLDRIDMQIEVAPVSFDELNTERSTENSAVIRQRVILAREIQEKRFAASQGAAHCNARMDHRQVRQQCPLHEEGKALLRTAMDRLGLSARAYDRILKVARTIADIEGSGRIETQHLAEAIQYRSLDREDWAG